MRTKLTLTIERSIIEKAKQYARKKNKSVSTIVQEYLNNLSAAAASASLNDALSAPITDSLAGMFADNGKDYRAMLNDAILVKF